MLRICTTEALVLKAYDTGDADRFCILLTESDGRVTAVAKGARKAGSRLGGSLQSFRHLRVDLAEHSSGFYLQSAQCIASFDYIRTDLPRFLLASRAAELLLHFLHDTETQSSIFVLALEFFEGCDRGGDDLLFATFQMILFRELGLLQSFKDDDYAPDVHAYLTSCAPLSERSILPLSAEDRRIVQKICDTLLQDHLSFPMKSKRVISAVS